MQLESQKRRKKRMEQKQYFKSYWPNFSKIQTIDLKVLWNQNSRDIKKVTSWHIKMKMTKINFFFFPNPGIQSFGTIWRSFIQGKWLNCGRNSDFVEFLLALFILFMGFSRQEYWSSLPFPSPVDHILSDLSTMIHPSWVAPPSMA